MKFLTSKGYLIEGQGMSYLAGTDPETALAPPQAVACTYRIELDPGRASERIYGLHPVCKGRNDDGLFY